LVWLAVVVSRAQAETVVIRGASVFDARQGVMVPGQTIVIDGERIQSTGADQSLPHIPSGATVIDARGKYVIPGLIDAHVHLVHVLDFAHITGDEILPLFLANGVTSVRDTGDQVVAEKLMAHYAEAHPDLSPRIFICSPFIDGKPPFHEDNGVSWGVTDPKEVPAFVDDMAAWGAVTVKLYVGTERPVGRRVIEEAHRHGLMVAGHLYKYTAQDAVEDGIDVLEHIDSVINYIFPPDAPTLPNSQEQAKMTPAALQDLHDRIEESRATLDLSNPTARGLIGTIAQHKVKVDPTLVVSRNMILLADLPEILENPDNSLMPARLKQFWPGYGPKLTSDTRDLRKRQFKKYQELTSLLFRSGVQLLCGTDTPEPNVPPGFSMHQELRLLVESGLPPAAALQAATIINAEALNQGGNLGSIEKGKLADLVILTDNPLVNINNTRKIDMVMRGGIASTPASLLKRVPSN
jgi:Amidohydrolase family